MGSKRVEAPPDAFAWEELWLVLDRALGAVRRGSSKLKRDQVRQYRRSVQKTVVAVLVHELFRVQSALQVGEARLALFLEARGVGPEAIPIYRAVGLRVARTRRLAYRGILTAAKEGRPMNRFCRLLSKAFIQSLVALPPVSAPSADMGSPVELIGGGGAAHLERLRSMRACSVEILSSVPPVFSAREQKLRDEYLALRAELPSFLADVISLLKEDA